MNEPSSETPPVSLSWQISADAKTVPAKAQTADLRCPHCGQPVSETAREDHQLVCKECGSSFRVEWTVQSTVTIVGGRLGRFQLLQCVGQGSFGAVWRARDMLLDRIVALKIPHVSLRRCAAHAARCQREARAAAQLCHPNIVRLYEAALIDGMTVLVSDFIDGRPLKELIESRRLTFREAAVLVMDIARALDYAHELGLVHRDVKPGNIMVAACPDKDTTSPGRPILVDFGLALRGEAEIVMTMDGQVIGTPAYMSPEQASGDGHRADRRSDEYSLGVVFYELLCGERPFRGSRAMMVHQVLHEEPRPPRKVMDKIPRDLETICLKAMAREPGKRYATAGALADDLGRFLHGEPIHARPAGRVERLWRWCRRNTAVASLIAAVFTVLLLGAATSTFWALRAGHNERVARENEIVAEHRRYVAEIKQALQDWNGRNLRSVRDLLGGQLPRPAGPDLRGFEWYWLERLSRQDLLTLPEFSGPVFGLALSPDGRWLACGDGKDIVLWDQSAEHQPRILRGHKQAIWDLAFSPDGRWLASIGGGFAEKGFVSGEVKIWDLTADREARSLPRDMNMVLSLAFSPDSRQLACGCGKWGDNGMPLFGEVHLVDVCCGNGRRTIPAGKDPVAGLAFSPDGRRLATAGSNVVQVWDAAVGGPALLTLSPHNPPTPRISSSVAFSPDGRYLAAGGWENEAYVWQTDKQGPLLFGGRKHDGPVRHVAFSPDSRRLATASDDRTVRIWDVATGEENDRLAGHADKVSRVVFSPDGWRIASASEDRTVKVWTSACPQSVFSSEKSPVRCLSFSADSSTLATGGHDNTIRLWDARLRTLKAVLRGHRQMVQGLAFSPTDDVLASAGRDHTIKLWSTITGCELRTLCGHGEPVWAVVFGPGGKQLVSAGRDGRIRLWDVETGEQLAEVNSGHGEVYCLAFDPNGRLASAGKDGRVRIWSGDLKKEFLDLDGHEGSVRCLAFSADGRLLASGGDDQRIRLRRADTAEVLHDLMGRTGAVWSVHFGPADRLVSGSDDGTIQLWDTHLGQPLIALPGHKDRAGCVAFSPDGSLLASGNMNDGLKIEDGRPLTPETAVKCEALALLKHLAGSPALSIEPARIRDDHTIRGPIRQRALDLAPQVADGLVRREADSLVRSLLNDGFVLRARLVGAIRQKPGLSNLMRKEALAQAEHFVENPYVLNCRSRLTLRQAKEPDSTYHIALCQAQAACGHEPDNPDYLVTLGMAHYRLGQYDDALSKLEGAKQRFADAGRPTPPALLAFLAMTHHRRGKRTRAQAALDQLHDSMRRSSGTGQDEAKAFLAEAEGLVGGKP
jgi:WD40 repeat protein